MRIEISLEKSTPCRTNLWPGLPVPHSLQRVVKDVKDQVGPGRRLFITRRCDEDMQPEIFTYKDALRRSAKRVAVAVGSAAVLNLVLLGVVFGTDPDTNVRLGLLATHCVASGAIIAGLLAGVMTYRTSLLMQDLSRARVELLRLSHTDQLTGLLNRRGYDEAALQALEQAEKSNVPAVAFMCDIDRFKAINDEFGHDFGDRVLIEIAEAMRSFGEANGMVVARHGGEEFAAFMIDVTTEQAVQHANALRRICAAKKISMSGGAFASVTLSIGLATSNDPTTLLDIMRTADQALYLAKRRGRDRVVPADVDANIIAA
jgi:diguanylate cyclase (GGDEF)-like protein